MSIAEIVRQLYKLYIRDEHDSLPTIEREIDHALWDVFNVKYGPLNVQQRAYFLRLLTAAFRKAQEGDRPVGLLLHLLRSSYNHEVVDAEFKRLRDVQEMAGVEDLVS